LDQSGYAETLGGRTVVGFVAPKDVFLELWGVHFAAQNIGSFKKMAL
jgi:hypothetical protein